MRVRNDVRGAETGFTPWTEDRGDDSYTAGEWWKLILILFSEDTVKIMVVMD